MRAVLVAARRAAWWPFGNMSSRHLYAARRCDHAALQEALARRPRARTVEERAVLNAARLLAAHNGSNRYGVAYYERRAAQQMLRGALDAHDRQVAA